MRLVVFSGVRGQPAALAALLQVVARQPASELVCLGGALPGPDPQGTLELMRKKGLLLVAGPEERAFLKSDELGALRPADVAFLRAASPPRRLTVGGKRVLLTTSEGDADVVVTPATCGALAASGESSYVVVDEDGSIARRTLAWSTRHV